MVLLRAQLMIAAAGRDVFLEAMQALVRASLAEAGCLQFGCYEDVFTPLSFVVLEVWETHEALLAHEQAPHLIAFKQRVGSLLVSREATQVYHISHVGPLGPA